ncbi:MAG: trypsin-like peptidase domain-containing protein [Oscillatoria sp. PMC 1068.18]|nr:trypsin-like peptidase domain-containing protein [Oscillatoria sp. PMC 1076.18]MEC4988817.1 trypsin-like peptidase domain-containing protein [Oscillatoria sp. PMC 1068.18]
MKPEHLVVSALFLSLATPAIAANATEPIILAQFSGEEQASIEVYRNASPAVVTIQAGNGSGSGSIISSEGLVITNYHVIRSARGGQVRVRTADGKSYSGSVLAADAPNDLALLRLSGGTNFPTLRLANESNIQIGQKVYAIGSPFGLSGTFTTGTLSRIAPNGDLQTDAAINPGNSGGPLLNSRGELIGVNKAILSPGGRGNIGIGFATSATEVQKFLVAARNPNRPNPRNAGATTAQGEPPRLGVSVDANTLIIQAVERGSLAARIGLRPGDRIVAVNRRRVSDVRQLLSFLDTNPDSALLTIVRDRRLATVQVNF